ncbi:TetR/AcrR family transcriptional regulator [Evansella sp. AB-P1]|uniref:TetR/AcrR family transcriptional regulator n=1 Tax=Evansella sp. AB-P1 TaxID=3037653 RepID=UPI00241CF2BC|nr:TetR/AcrR family transcriptional regulator [Evansella sp. AB-P1]MDG5786781.1 TetR/AcrR family transcriptional regulator [Evansella sp. AB-P1]
MDGFMRRREQKKTEILKAALDLFMTHGVQKVSISEIAKTANVSQVTIYNYFESKHNLAKETIHFYVDDAWAEMEAVVSSDIPFEEKIKALIFNKKEAANRIHPEFYNYFMKEYTAGITYIEEFYQKRAIPRLVQLFNEGREKGFIDPTISNEAIIMYMHMIKDSMQREEIYSKILPHTEDITKLMFYGILGNKKD